MKTIEGLKTYITSCIGLPYWPHTYGQNATKSLASKVFKDCQPVDVSADLGKKVHDSAGLIKGYMWSTGTGSPCYKSSQDISPYGFYLLSKHGKADTFPKTNGTYLYKSVTNTSVGIYQMAVYYDGYVYQCEKGKGVTCTLYRVQDWPYWSECNLLE